MTRSEAVPSSYICPMHADVRQPGPGRCPSCGMALVPEGARFGLFQHLRGNLVHVIAVVLLTISVISLVMLWVRSAG